MYVLLWMALIYYIAAAYTLLLYVPVHSLQYTVKTMDYVYKIDIYK